MDVSYSSLICRQRKIMRQTEMLALVSVALTVLLLSHTSHGAPTSEDDLSGSRSEESYPELLPQLQEWLWRTRGGRGAHTRERKAQFDAGFLSRHSAVSDYLRGLDAHRQASNPYGPGRRK